MRATRSSPSSRTAIGRVPPSRRPTPSATRAATVRAETTTAEARRGSGRWSARSCCSAPFGGSSRGSGADGGTSQAAAAGDGDELSRLSLDELSKQGSTLLVEVDDAVKTSEQEVAFAAAQFGDETAAPFAAAVERAKADLARAFQLRRAIDDSTPDDETARREMLTEIISLTQGASDRLDAEVDRFDELRAMEQNAPELLAGLATRLSALEGRLPGAEATLGGLTATYAPAAVATVLDNPRQAGERLAFARGEVTEGNVEVAAGNRGKAAVAIRGAEEALGQAGQLVDAIDRLGADLADADDKIRAAIPGVVEDITAARALAGQRSSLVEHVARAEQSLAAAEVAASTTDGQDPLGALHRLEEAGKALDAALADAREEEEQARRARATLEQTLSSARQDRGGGGLHHDPSWRGRRLGAYAARGSEAAFRAVARRLGHGAADRAGARAHRRRARGSGPPARSAGRLGLRAGARHGHPRPPRRRWRWDNRGRDHGGHPH